MRLVGRDAGMENRHFRSFDSFTIALLPDSVNKVQRSDSGCGEREWVREQRCIRCGTRPLQSESGPCAIHGRVLGRGPRVVVVGVGGVRCEE